jgi:hypothetical protein
MSNNLKLQILQREGVDTQAIDKVTSRGKSASLATDLTLEGELSQMFCCVLTRGDTLSGAFAEDIRAAEFDVVRAPTEASPLHVRFIAGENTFNDTGRDSLSLAFDQIARKK